jgi:leucyl aminopeptidase
MADLLSHLRERALAETNPKLFTVATLTGHAAIAVGPYSIALDNFPARQAGVASALEAAGDAWGDPFDVSRLRREDWDFVKPRSKADEVLSCNNAASSGTARGHQFPMAFLAIAAGMVDHSGRNATQPLPYTHIDIAGSAVVGGDWQHGRPTGAPIVAMLKALT